VRKEGYSYKGRGGKESGTKRREREKAGRGGRWGELEGGLCLHC